jgi:hypothetical protein
MPWGKPRKGGWGPAGAGGAGASEAGGSRFSQVIRTIISIVPGGCLRYGKNGPEDDLHTGFWLGVDPADNLAKFSIGSDRFWFKWDGHEARYRGGFSTYCGEDGPAVIQWVGQDGNPAALMFAVEGGWHWLTIHLPQQAAAGDVNMLDLELDGDFASNLRLRLVTEKGAGQAGTKVLVQVGNGEVFSIDGTGNVWARGDLAAGGNVTGANLGGWTGTFRTDEINAVTVEGGRITGVV